MSYRAKAAAVVADVVPCDSGDERFRLMTNGAFTEGFGSTCGYLCHYVLWSLFRDANVPPGDPRLDMLNWADPDLGTLYHPGENISRLVHGAQTLGGGIWQPRTTRDTNGGAVLWDPSPGDLVFCSNGPANSEHVFVFLSTDQKAWNSADAGQTNAAGHQAARWKTRALTANGQGLEFLSGPRQIQGFVNLDWLGLKSDAPANAGGSPIVPLLVCGAFLYGLTGGRL